jgi:hypothetical protein
MPRLIDSISSSVAKQNPAPDAQARWLPASPFQPPVDVLPLHLFAFTDYHSSKQSEGFPPPQLPLTPSFGRGQKTAAPPFTSIGAGLLPSLLSPHSQKRAGEEDVRRGMRGYDTISLRWLTAPSQVGEIGGTAVVGGHQGKGDLSEKVSSKGLSQSKDGWGPPPPTSRCRYTPIQSPTPFATPFATPLPSGLVNTPIEPSAEPHRVAERPSKAFDP